MNYDNNGNRGAVRLMTRNELGELGIEIIDIQPAVETASKEIRAGMERLKSDFWAGFGYGIITVLALRYVLQGEL